MKNQLSEILAKYSDTDKDTLHSYAEVYENILINKRESIKNVLEVGVREGGSLKAWADYLPNAKIHGIDNGEEKGMWVSDQPNRIFVHYGDVKKPETIFKIGQIYGPFDFIVEDSLHIEQTQIATYAVLRNFMNPGGIYVVEDCQDILVGTRIAETFGGELIDRRYVKNRHDDVLVVFRS